MLGPGGDGVEEGCGSVDDGELKVEGGTLSRADPFVRLRVGLLLEGELPALYEWMFHPRPLDLILLMKNWRGTPIEPIWLNEREAS